MGNLFVRLIDRALQTLDLRVDLTFVAPHVSLDDERDPRAEGLHFLCGTLRPVEFLVPPTFKLSEGQ